MLPLIGVVVLLGIVAFVVKMALPGLGKAQVALPYQKEPVLFTPAERSFLAVLEQALGDQFRVLGKVRLADVIRVKSGRNRTEDMRVCAAGPGPDKEDGDRCLAPDKETIWRIG